MDEENQEKTAFITSQGLYCYKVMPFGLKNAGGHVPEISEPYVLSADRKECGSVRRRHAGKE